MGYFQTGGAMKITETKNGYLLCPVCGRPTKTKVVPGVTRLHRFPLFCKWCKKETNIDYE